MIEHKPGYFLGCECHVQNRGSQQKCPEISPQSRRWLVIVWSRNLCNCSNSFYCFLVVWFGCDIHRWPPQPCWRPDALPIVQILGQLELNCLVEGNEWFFSLPVWFVLQCCEQYEKWWILGCQMPCWLPGMKCHVQARKQKPTLLNYGPIHGPALGGGWSAGCWKSVLRFWSQASCSSQDPCTAWWEAYGYSAWSMAGAGMPKCTTKHYINMHSGWYKLV